VPTPPGPITAAQGALHMAAQCGAPARPISAALPISAASTA
jgi:hypothetical protein